MNEITYTVTIDKLIAETLEKFNKRQMSLDVYTNDDDIEIGVIDDTSNNLNISIHLSCNSKTMVPRCYDTTTNVMLSTTDYTPPMSKFPSDMVFSVPVKNLFATVRFTTKPSNADIHSYLVATARGGTLEKPEFTYSNLEIVTAIDECEAVRKYNIAHNCNYFYGVILAQLQ